MMGFHPNLKINFILQHFSEISVYRYHYKSSDRNHASANFYLYLLICCQCIPFVSYNPFSETKK